MAIPADVAAHFILIESQVFGGLQILFDVPTTADGLDHEGQRRSGASEDEVGGDLAGIVEAATKEEEVAVIDAALMDDGQDGPGEETLTFGAQALGEEVPVGWTQGLLLDGGHISQQAAVAGLDSDDLNGGDRQSVGVVLLFQPEAQVRAVA
jgi:hypothetical protein